jgi:hypothetical protein
LRAHATTPAGRAAIGAIYQKYIPLDDPTLYGRIGLAIAPPDLKVVVEGKFALRWQMAQYVGEGLVQTAPNLAKSVDNSFADTIEKAIQAAAKAAPKK